jgi:hypothetical protein
MASIKPHSFYCNYIHLTNPSLTMQCLVSAIPDEAIWVYYMLKNGSNPFISVTIEHAL